jgi:formylglycine-generating enzyme required for sulfatase activity
MLGLTLLLSGAAAAVPLAGDLRQDSLSGMTFVYVPAGCFEMGSGQGSADEQPVHKVCFEQGFWLGQTEVTQAQYAQVMGEDRSLFADEDDNPSERVTWLRAVKVAEQLSAQGSSRYRLPSEAEWEYACTAGGQHWQFCGEGEADDVAWYLENSDESTQPVGEKEANAWGLLDMSGNVREWVLDCWNPDYQGAPSDGSAWLSGDCSLRGVRGGSWTVDEQFLRPSNRNRTDRTLETGFIGFRLVLEP